MSVLSLSYTHSPNTDINNSQVFQHHESIQYLENKVTNLIVGNLSQLLFQYSMKVNFVHATDKAQRMMKLVPSHSLQEVAAL